MSKSKLPKGCEHDMIMDKKLLELFDMLHTVTTRIEKDLVQICSLNKKIAWREKELRGKNTYRRDASHLAKITRKAPLKVIQKNAAIDSFMAEVDDEEYREF